MAEEFDPHHLVALMSFVFTRKQEDGASRRSEVPSDNIKYGVSDDLPTNVRTVPVLDALASVSISRPRSQVVAISLQVDPSNEEIHLTIAENSDVTPDLVNHLTHIWELLRRLSNEYADQRGDGLSNQNYLGTSPDVPDGVGENLQVRIFRDVYQYALAKQMRRVGKWWNGLLDFMKELNERRVGRLTGLEQTLDDTVFCLGRVLELVKGQHQNPQIPLTELEWRKVFLLSRSANERVTLILEARDQFCETLATELAGIPSFAPQG